MKTPKYRHPINISIEGTKNGFIIQSTFMSRTERHVADEIDEVFEIIKEIHDEQQEYNEDREEE